MIMDTKDQVSKTKTKYRIVFPGQTRTHLYFSLMVTENKNNVGDWRISGILSADYRETRESNVSVT